MLSDHPRPSLEPDVLGDESWELIHRIRQEARQRLTRAVPTTGRLTREGVAAVVRQWAASAEPVVQLPWLEDQLAEVIEIVVRSTLSDWAYDVLWWLRQEPQPYDGAAVVATAELCVVHGLDAHGAVNLLSDLGPPHGERALLRLVRDDRVREDDRAWPRDSLRRLRSPRYRARGQQQPAPGEHPLLPPVVRELRYGWDTGFIWPRELPETEANIARARAILEACAPEAPVPDPVPAPDWTGDADEDEEQPAWLEIRAVLREFMPYADMVTEERITEAMRECALLGVPGVPRDPDGGEAERFVRRWVTWIGGWIAGEVFTWLGMCVDDDTLVTPWAMELAERYARFGVATDQAVSMLHWHGTVPRSRQALARLTTDGTLPP